MELNRESIQQGNNAIADFMGLNKFGNSSCLIDFIDITMYECSKEDLKYHNDWNWLIPVYTMCHKIWTGSEDGCDAQFHCLQEYIRDNRIEEAFLTIVVIIDLLKRHHEQGE